MAPQAQGAYMTVTEAPRDVGDVAVGSSSDQASPTPSPGGLAALVGSGDPRAVGKLFVGTSLLFLAVSGVAGLLVGFEQIDVTSFDGVLGTDAFAQVDTFEWVTGIFLGLLPLMIGLATAVVPLQVGASTVAFPRASAAAYWGYLVSGGLIIASYVVNGGPFGGDEGGAALFVVSLVAALAALSVATLSVVTTVISLRAPGMSLRKTPLFSWSMLVAGSIWLLTLPVLAGILVFSYLDLTYGQLLLSDDAVGAGWIYSDLLWDRIVWMLWQPAVYSLAIPALGIVADIVPVFAQRRHKRHLGAMVLVGLFGALTFGAWTQLPVDAVQPDSVASVPWLYEGPWIAVSVLAVLPMLGLLGLWTGTLFAGRPRLGGPLLCALISGALLLGALAAGVGTVVEDLDLVGTTWQTGQLYLVFFAVLVAGLGGLAYWAPKLYGSTLPDGLVSLAAGLFLLAAGAVAIPLGIAGLLDQPRWLARDAEGRGFAEIMQGFSSSDVDTIEVLNLVAAIGGAVALAAGSLAILAVVRAALSRRHAGDDPWRGHTLEWTTSSPPPVGNFASLLEVTSEAPLYDARHAPAAGAGTPDTAQDQEASA
jgi:cytochrome c oxidase subunit I